ncbi:hypothetical protein Cni_G29266 [Canna indica]|uniref:Peptide deformylase n=1 Tax=Canna indica TaxID=4628 RepID=A0AAQ3QT36_9LILI|nr:hypothetical protein Cni_G29266 [Canna indica]
MTESIHRFSHCYVSFLIPSATTRTLAILGNFKPHAAATALPFSFVAPPFHAREYLGGFGTLGSRFSLSLPQRRIATGISTAGWFWGFGAKKGKGVALPGIDKAENPVIHEPADEVPPQEIGPEKIQKIIEHMVAAMRKAPSIGLATPQTSVPLKLTFFFISLHLQSKFLN